MTLIQDLALTVTLKHGRRLRGNWGDGPPKIWGGGRPMHPSPNISRSTVIGYETQYEL